MGRIQRPQHLPLLPPGRVPTVIAAGMELVRKWLAAAIGRTAEVAVKPSLAILSQESLLDAGEKY